MIQEIGKALSRACVVVSGEMCQYRCIFVCGLCLARELKGEGGEPPEPVFGGEEDGGVVVDIIGVGGRGGSCRRAA